jgi:hypothetical protein
MDKQSTSVEIAPLETFNVKIVGHQYISKKLFEVVEHLLADFEVAEYKAINEITFGDEPEGKFGAFNPETRDISINLERHFEDAVKWTKEEELSYLSLGCHLWLGILRSITHEMIHAMTFAIDPENMINKDRKEIEAEVKIETRARLADLFRKYGPEPADMADEPFFGSRYMEFYVKNIKENSEQWAVNQNEVYNTGFVYKDGELSCTTFREWYRSCYNHAADPEWDNELEPLLTAEVEDEVIPVEVTPVVEDTPDVIELVGKTAKPDTTDVIELPDGPVETETVISPSAEIIEALPEGLDPETLALLDMDESIEVDMEAEFTPLPAMAPVEQQAVTELMQPVQSAPIQQELPLQVAPSAVCKSCNTALAVNAKFCAQCGTSVIETPMPELPAAVPSATTALPAAPQPSSAQPQQFSYGAKRPMRHDLPNCNLSAEQIRACVGEVFIRCYQHIFSKCGWRPAQNPSFAPELRNAVTEPISVVGIPCIDQVLIGMDSVDSMTGSFTWCVPSVNGMIRGKITKNLGLPSYTLYFNFNGHEAKRLIMPQNQWKVGGQGYSGPAQRAQQGAMIIWMMDGDDSTPGQKWRAKIENGTLEWLI